MDPHWIATAFSAVNSIRVVFYLPQIVAVARSTDGARDIALSTWGMWALTNGLGTAYGALVAHDLVLALSFALSLLCCATTIALTLVQRVRWARRGAGRAHRAQPVGSQARRGLAECCPAHASRNEDSSAAASAVRSALRSTLARRRNDSARSMSEGASMAPTPAARSPCSNALHAAAARVGSTAGAAVCNSSARR